MVRHWRQTTPGKDVVSNGQFPAAKSTSREQFSYELSASDALRDKRVDAFILKGDICVTHHSIHYSYFKD
jgi:hypothetical protein